MSFSGMLFLTFLGLIVFGPKKLPHVGKQIGRVFATLRSFSGDFKSQLETEMEGASKQENIALASSPQSKLPAETGPRLLENDTFGSKPERVEAFRG